MIVLRTGGDYIFFYVMNNCNNVKKIRNMQSLVSEIVSVKTKKS